MRLENKKCAFTSTDGATKFIALLEDLVTTGKWLTSLTLWILERSWYGSMDIGG